MHCSPPSLAVVAAAERALRLNERCGDALRDRLARNVARFRERLAGKGVRPRGGPFPVQTVDGAGRAGAAVLHARLLRRGVRAVLHAGRGGEGALLGFLLTAAHSPDDITRAADALLSAAGLNERRVAPCGKELRRAG
jgi:8-amino-7-oxononanoate synthase